MNNRKTIFEKNERSRRSFAETATMWQNAFAGKCTIDLLAKRKKPLSVKFPRLRQGDPFPLPDTRERNFRKNRRAVRGPDLIIPMMKGRRYAWIQWLRNQRAWQPCRALFVLSLLFLHSHLFCLSFSRGNGGDCPTILFGCDGLTASGADGWFHIKHEMEPNSRSSTLFTTDHSIHFYEPYTIG